MPWSRWLLTSALCLALSLGACVQVASEDADAGADSADGAGGAGGGSAGSAGSAQSPPPPRYPEHERSYCEHLALCGVQNLDECQAAQDLYVLSESCSNAIQAEDCGALLVGESQALSVCFPPCTTAGTCLGNGTLRACDQGQEIVVDCTALCASGGLPWTGSCSTTYAGQTSDTGADVCWCG